MSGYDRRTFGLPKLPYSRLLEAWKATDVILLVLLLVANSYIWEIEPFQRQFTINDLTISHPYAKHERVPGKLLSQLSLGLPSIVIIAVAPILTKENRLKVLFISLLGLYMSLFVNSLITGIIKNWIGRLRPDFLARCIPKPDTPPDVLVYAKDVCTQTNMKRLLDGFRTTPSGHSSTSFAGLGYLTIWLCSQLVAAHKGVGSWRSIVCSVPFMVAFYVAMSRTQDYRHHFVDVLLGSILGQLVAWWSYRRYFPSVCDEGCYLPIEVENDYWTPPDEESNQV